MAILLIGFNLVLIICCLLGVLLAKVGDWGWLIYWIGVIFTAIVLFQTVLTIISDDKDALILLGLLILTSIVIAAAGAYLIKRRRR